VCDVAYVLLIDDLRQRVYVDRQVAALYRSRGMDIELPDFDEQRERLDKFLDSEFRESRNDSDSELLEALGLRPRG